MYIYIYICIIYIIKLCIYIYIYMYVFIYIYIYTHILIVLVVVDGAERSTLLLLRPQRLQAFLLGDVNLELNSIDNCQPWTQEAASNINMFQPCTKEAARCRDKHIRNIFQPWTKEAARCCERSMLPPLRLQRLWKTGELATYRGCLLHVEVRVRDVLQARLSHRNKTLLLLLLLIIIMIMIII